MDYIRNHKVGFLLTGLVLLTILKTAVAFSSGYAGKFYIFTPACTDAFRYIFIILSAIVLVSSELDRKQKTLLLLLLVFLIAIGLILTDHFMTLGALLSIQNAGPEQIRSDARLLLDQYEPNTLFSDYEHQRHPFELPTPKNELPPSLQNEIFVRS